MSYLNHTSASNAFFKNIIADHGTLQIRPIDISQLSFEFDFLFDSLWDREFHGAARSAAQLSLAAIGRLDSCSARQTYFIGLLGRQFCAEFCVTLTGHYRTNTGAILNF